ncbi:MAG: thiamine-phosphate kinase, partial [Chloroflexota bacterium]
LWVPRPAPTQLMCFQMEEQGRMEGDGAESHGESAGVDEFSLIAQLSAILGPQHGLVGIGDDTAVLDVGGDDLLLATVDMHVENVHFRRSLDPVILGRRLLAINVSDIAAMGGRPEYGLVSLALPADVPQGYVRGMYQGLRIAGMQYGVSIVGGNVTSTSGPLAADLTLLGRVSRKAVVRRSGALVGNALAVTGTLGNAAILRLACERGWRPRAPVEQQWFDSEIVPHPPAAAAWALAQAAIPTAMMDISDGLSGDIQHLCAASAVGARLNIRALPVDQVAITVAESAGVSTEAMALSGGEDYQLLIALAREHVEEAAKLIAPIALTVVGEITAQEEGIVVISADGASRHLPQGAWRHF